MLLFLPLSPSLLFFPFVYSYNTMLYLRIRCVFFLSGKLRMTLSPSAAATRSSFNLLFFSSFPVFARGGRLGHRLRAAVGLTVAATNPTSLGAAGLATGCGRHQFLVLQQPTPPLLGRPAWPQAAGGGGPHPRSNQPPNVSARPAQHRCTSFIKTLIFVCHCELCLACFSFAHIVSFTALRCSCS
jgi:hypothetical protein